MKKAQIRKLRQTVKNRQKKPGFFGYVISKLKTYLFTGILVTMPVTITFYMAYELFVWMDKWTRSLIPPQVAAHEFVPYIPGIGVVMLIIVLILIGMFTTGFIGRFFVRLGDFIAARVVIYPEPLPLFFLLELSNHFLRPLHRLFPHQGKCRFLHSDGRFHRLHRHSGGIGSERMFQPGFKLAGILQYDGRDSRNRLHLCVHLSNDLSDTKIQKRETG